MDLRDTAIAALVAREPQQSGDELLGLLMDHTGATAGGLFVGRGGTLDLLSLRHLDQNGLDRVRGLWLRNGQHLRDGRPLCEPLWSLWPIGDRPMLVYLESDQLLPIPIIREAVATLGPALTTGFGIGSGTAEDELIDGYLERTPPDRIHRRQLVTLLNRNEWNLSRVARILGVSRLTVYKRMRRLGIERLRMYKRRPAASVAS